MLRLGKVFQTWYSPYGWIGSRALTTKIGSLCSALLQKCVCGRNVVVWKEKFRKEVPFNLRVSQRTLSIYRRYTWWNVSMQQISAKCQPTSRICTMKMTFEGHNFPFFGQENLLFFLRESLIYIPCDISVLTGFALLTFVGLCHDCGTARSRARRARRSGELSCLKSCPYEKLKVE